MFVFKLTPRYGRLLIASLTLIACAVIFIHYAQHKEDGERDLNRLQGTWRLVEYKTGWGKVPVTEEFLWIFQENKFYRKSAYGQMTYEVRVDPMTNPKTLEMLPRFFNVSRKQSSPSYVIYKFEGERLLVAHSRVDGKYPQSFVPSKPDDKTSVVSCVETWERIDREGKIPEEMLRNFDDVSIKRSRNSEAETALVQFFIQFTKGKSLEVIRPFVADGKAEELLKVFANRSVDVPEDFDEMVKEWTARDAEIGERLTVNGELLKVGAEHFQDDRVLLVLQEKGADQQPFWLSRDGGRWKVDVTGFIAEKRSRDLGLFGGILVGMTQDRVRGRLNGYKLRRQLQSFEMIRETDSELIVDWRNESGKLVRHTWSFVDGKLVGYASEVRAQ